MKKIIVVKEGPTDDGLRSWYVLSDSEFEDSTEADMALEESGVTADFIEWNDGVARIYGYSECGIFHEEV